MRKYLIVFVSSLVFASFVSYAGPPPGIWNSAEILDKRPLEAKIAKVESNGVGGLDDFALWLSIVLSNQAANVNRIDAVFTPSPFNGTGGSSTFIDSGSIFAVGDICTQGNTAVVPYIKDFNIEVARFNGTSWSTSTLPGTTTNNFTTTDCGVSPDGMFISGQNFDQGSVDLFRSTNGGNDYTFYGRYADVRSPFHGAVRDQLITSPIRSEAATLGQASNGNVVVRRFATNGFNPTPISTDVLASLTPPPGSFTEVRESAGAAFRQRFQEFFPDTDGYIFTFNAEGPGGNRVRTATWDLNSVPTLLFNRDLGALTNSGTQFPFQAATIVHVDSEQPTESVLWSDYYTVDQVGTVTTDPSYPIAGVGGPTDGCLATFSEQDRRIFVVGSDTAGLNTRLYSRQEIPTAIFADGFESGNTTRWSANCD